jgi:5-methylcytosine-specific restriction endonuclease McrA
MAMKLRAIDKITLTTTELERRKKLGLPYKLHPGGKLFNAPPPSRQELKAAKKAERRAQKKLLASLPEPPKVIVNYLDYLDSDYWRARRILKMRSAGFKCQRCGGRKNLQVHHRSYERLGRELDSDLELLCRNCHEAEHEGMIAADSHLRAIATE